MRKTHVKLRNHSFARHMYIRVDMKKRYCLVHVIRTSKTSKMVFIPGIHIGFQRMPTVAIIFFPSNFQETTTFDVRHDDFTSQNLFLGLLLNWSDRTLKPKIYSFNVNLLNIHSLLKPQYPDDKSWSFVSLP